MRGNENEVKCWSKAKMEKSGEGEMKIIIGMGMNRKREMKKLRKLTWRKKY